MKTNIFRQTVYELRTQRVASAVTIIGTALTIFLVMTVMMIDRSTTAPFAPESNRPRLLYGQYIDIYKMDNSGSSSGSMSLSTARRIYEGLNGVEHVAYITHWNDRIDAEQTGRSPVLIYRRYVDDNFWKIFDHTFIAGNPFDKATIDGNTKVAILSEDAVRAIMGVSPQDAIGQSVKIGQENRIVTGVTATASPLASYAYAQVFIPVSEKSRAHREHFGEICAVLLTEPGTSEDDVRRQVIQRYDDFNREIKLVGDTAIYHGQPYPQEIAATTIYSNQTPDITPQKREKLVILLLLLLVPSVNMSAMTQARLKKRTAEMAIKRAYGASKRRLLAEILTENMLLTLIGGIIGLAASLIGCRLLGNKVFSDTEFTGVDINISFDILFSWSLFGYTLAACFILNFLAAGIPAWRASHAAPAEALRG